MAKITRKTAQVFGANASPIAIEQFASFETNGKPTFTNNAATIISLPAWGLGWTAAQYNGVLAPYFEDRNCVDLYLSQQVAEIFQDGIPPWDSATPYFTNSIVQLNGQIFISLQDNNQGNSPSAGASNAYWNIQNLPQNLKAPTRTILGTQEGINSGINILEYYYTPPGCVRLFVRIIGGGAGGAVYYFTSSNILEYVTGTNGGPSFFWNATANGGQASQPGPTLGLGGTASGGDVNISGGIGVAQTTVVGNQGAGGSSYFGNGGQKNSDYWNNGISAAVWGAGGSGAFGNTNSLAGGGGGGGYCEITITNPQSQYSWQTGGGGYAGNYTYANGPYIGGYGASGLIIVDEFYF